MRKIKPILILLLLIPASLIAEGRFFLEGDGTLLVQGKKGKGVPLRYRTTDGVYSEKGMRKIARGFGVPPESGEEVSWRLIALLDYLQDNLKAGPLKLVSGFRTGEHNERLREQGLPAASDSLHLDGMAADIQFAGLSSKKGWDFLRGLNCCGAGYYHGKSLHVDIGPSRFWDEKTSGVTPGPPPANKRIIVRTDRDIYQPGETVTLRLARVNSYPFSVESEIRISALSRRGRKFKINGATGSCLPVSGRKQRTLYWTIPGNLSPKERVTLVVRFCPNDFPEMPGEIESNPIQIGFSQKER